MGTYDGAEVCELVGSVLFFHLSNKYIKKDIGLYRDDGLAVFENKSGPKVERIKKIFKNFSVKMIVIKCILKIVDYLDVTLNLLNNTNLSLNLTTKSTTNIRNPTTHRLKSSKYLFQSSQVFSEVRKF